MATAAAAARKPDVKESNFTWVGTDKANKTVRGEMKATGEAQVNATLRRQGIRVVEIKKQRLGRGGSITDKDVTLFVRQLATMMKSGVPLLQAFDIVGKGHTNPAVARLLMDVKTDVETGASLKQAFEKHPLYFDALFCNLVGAGEAAGILDSLLDRLATYKEKILAIKSKIKAALFYPIAIIIVAFIITAVIMIFVIQAFKQVFASFGADLPTPTLMVMAMSDFFVTYWYAIFGGLARAHQVAEQRVEIQGVLLERLLQARARFDVGLDVEQQLRHRGVAVALADDIEGLQQRHARLHHGRHLPREERDVLLGDPAAAQPLSLDLDDPDALAAQRRVDLGFPRRTDLSAHGLAGPVLADPGVVEFLDVRLPCCCSGCSCHRKSPNCPIEPRG